ncbi:heterokaryon incompatibility protein-domain-containing protein [Paraphoma chrysanthemicola]|uniref:Heterokaryon incompatibility protein-domain-containing protein n=1 Tax=Paraphoma chrysanthemicola TaxID=798071 RepID=A0A8K0RJA6_9PLEO|nr:heterokaryon incompatibility protein-domain-containing protein [Paraphoma chrysanthemicola]
MTPPYRFLKQALKNLKSHRNRAKTPNPDQPINDADELGPIYKDITELCDFCVELTTMMVEKEVDYEGLESLPEPRHCKFCQILLNVLLGSEWTAIRSPPFLKSLRASTHLMHESDRFCGFDIGPPGHPQISFALWVDNDGIAFASLTDRAPIVIPQMSHACNLAKYWLDKCKNHTECLPEDEAPLPTRVLELSVGHTKPSLMLVDGNTKQGRYLALSHCWGSTKNWPLRTTRHNIEEYQSIIPFDDLPRTFRDFAEFSQGLGVKYIWIDSLCIVQDDSEDWHSEAEKMGDVYRNATLVVAASGAKNSTEGLFITDRPRAIVYRLPYRPGGVYQGTFNLTRVYERESYPFFGALDKRAWALQERVLARKIVSFMPGGMTWHCESVSIDEFGRGHAPFIEAFMWSLLLESYSAKDLTYPSDRLKALKGIVAHLQRSRTDQYYQNYGVWQERLTEQLFWLHVGPQTADGALTLPSWSWATTQSRKTWPKDWLDPSDYYVRLSQAEELSRHVEITTAGCIQMVGLLGTTQSHTRRIRGSGAAWNWTRIILESSFHLFRVGLYSIQKTQRVLYGRKHDGKAVVGLVFFDHKRRTSCTHLLLAFKANRISPRSPKSVQYKGKDIDRADTQRALPDVDFIYWTLLLDKVEEGKYKRVGVGVLFPSAYEAFRVEYKEIGLV